GDFDAWPRDRSVALVRAHTGVSPFAVASRQRATALPRYYQAESARICPADLVKRGVEKNRRLVCKKRASFSGPIQRLIADPTLLCNSDPSPTVNRAGLLRWNPSSSSA